MDFQYSPEEEAFRAELGAWLTEHAPKFRDLQGTEMHTPEFERLARGWQREMAEGGWAGLAWPKEYGGRGATLIERVIYEEEMAEHDAPAQPNVIAIAMAGPVIMQLGTEEQKQRYIAKMLNGEEFWCQGFSEPGAGSDLANVQTRAVTDGDDYIINGQKVWTSFAHFADWCILVVRTDPEAKKHKGLTFLLVDMQSEGISTRPLVQITGGQEFNEVFFDNVRVPKKNRIGDENDGWRVAIATLMFERGGLGGYDRFRKTVDALIRLAQSRAANGGKLSDDPLVRQRLAQAHIEVEILRLNGMRALTNRLRGEAPGPEGSISKLYWSEMNQRFQALATELLGPYHQLGPGDPFAIDDGKWVYGFLRSQGNTIEAGTSAIQRNIISERVLGLPKDAARA